MFSDSRKSLGLHELQTEDHQTLSSDSLFHQPLSNDSLLTANIAFYASDRANDTLNMQ